MRRTTFRPIIVAALAVSQISTPALPTFQFPGPYSIAVLEERIAEFKTSLESLSELKLKEEFGRWEKTDSDQCSGGRERKSLQSHMSQTPIASGPESNSVQEGNQAGYFSKPTTLPPIVDPFRSSPPRFSENGNPTPGKTPGSTVQSRGSQMDTSSNDAEQGLSRPIRMHNILNPAGATEDKINQRSVIQLESPQTSVSSNSWRPSERSTQSQSPSSISTHSINMPISRIHPLSSNQLNRQSATPGSSMNHYGALGTNGTIDAKESPFLSGRSHYIPSASSSSSFPAVSADYKPSVAIRPSFGSIPQNATPPDRQGGIVVPPAPSSQGDSPNTSYSSYSQMSRASPSSSQSYNISTVQTSSSAHYGSLATTRGTASERQPITLGSELSYGPVTSAGGHSTYQLMAFDTDQGPIQVPVDVQAASKMADEKRKRNAGASQRFRQRRKDKERESSTTISKLENQIREIGEEKEYYRLERDYFRGLVYSSSAQAQVVPRLPSPRLRKFSQAGNIGTMVESQWQQPEERGGQAGRNTRRRISAYAPNYEQSSTTMAAPTQSPGYPPTPPMQFSHPPPRTASSVARPPPSGLPPPRPGPHDPPPSLPSWNNTR